MFLFLLCLGYVLKGLLLGGGFNYFLIIIPIWVNDPI